MIVPETLVLANAKYYVLSDQFILLSYDGPLRKYML